jgi:hypothetical protein
MRTDIMATARINENRFTVWPTTLACCLPVALIALWTGPFDLAFMGVPVLLMIWTCSALFAAGIAISAIKARSWKQVVSMSTLPLATLVVAANFGTLWPFAIETGESIHFHVMRSSYLKEVSKLPTNEPRFAMWRWGGFGIGHAVIYDESDEILSREQSLVWKKRVADTEVGMCGAWGSSLGDHFYLVRTGC